MARNAAEILTLYAGWAATAGEPERGVAMADRVARLDPGFPPRAAAQFARAYFMAGRYRAALAMIERLPADGFTPAIRAMHAGALAAVGRTEDAAGVVGEALTAIPDTSIEAIANAPDLGEAERRRLIETMRLAGFPPCAAPQALPDRARRLPDCAARAEAPVPMSATGFVVNGVSADFAAEVLRDRSGAAVPLRPQSFAVLRHLAGNPDRLVTKEELTAAVWPEVAVTDDSLVQCIHEIRRALGDDQHVVLQTAARRGYRLVIPPEPVAVTPPTGASIAVLRFDALDPAGDGGYFADGLAEDLITSLSKIPGLFVIARNSSFAYRGGAVDLRRAAAELGVRYLLQGSVRRSGGGLRINARLVDGASAAQVWAGRFDGSAADVFALQDRLTEQIVGAIEPSIRRAEIERARRKHPESLDAYDLYLRALPHALSNTADGCDRALRVARRGAGARSRLPAGARPCRLVPRAALFPRRLRPGRPGGGAAPCRRRARGQRRRPAGDEHRRLRAREPDPRLRRRRRGARPGAGDERQLGAGLRVQRARRRAQRAARAGGRACREGAAAQPARRSAELSSLLRAGADQPVRRAASRSWSSTPRWRSAPTPASRCPTPTSSPGR